MNERMCDVQARRHAAEPAPRDWPTKRAAIIDAGMVEERRKLRDRNDEDDGNHMSAYLGLGDENAPESAEWPW